MLVRAALRKCGVPVLESMPIVVKFPKDAKIPTVYWRPQNPRVGLYELALFGFVVAAFEEFIHLNIAAQGTDASDYGYWVGLLAVILFANGLPLWQVLTSWAAIEYKKTEPDSGTCWARFRHDFWVCSASPYWAPFELATGASYLFFFGAGFFIGPVAIMLAALVRLGELKRADKPKLPRQIYKLEFNPVRAPSVETSAFLPPILFKP